MEVIVVSSTETYRRLARELPHPEDAVLEIGCSAGGATRQLVKTGACVVAVDNSRELSARVRSELRAHGNLKVACVDAKDIPAVAGLMPTPTLVFLDIGGNAPLDLVALHLRLVLRAFRPRVIVVRSFELALLTGMIKQTEAPADPSAHPDHYVSFGRDIFAHLLDLSASSRIGAREWAAWRLKNHDCPTARQRLREMCADPHPRVRKAALRALRALGEDTSSASLPV
jgi:SAM-dependent methyltransferase